MRKLKLQVQMTLDGFIAGPNGEMDWMSTPWTEDINAYVTSLTSTVDTIVLGRKLAEGFIPYWSGVAGDDDNPEQSAGKLFTDTHKIVFTKSLQTQDVEELRWKNTLLAKGDLVEEINNLKNKEGMDIIAYGGAEFVSDLIINQLVDDYYLFINPVAIGEGKSIFASLEQKQELTLVDTHTFEAGIIVLHYSKV